MYYMGGHPDNTDIPPASACYRDTSLDYADLSRLHAA